MERPMLIINARFCQLHTYTHKCIFKWTLFVLIICWMVSSLDHVRLYPKFDYLLTILFSILDLLHFCRFFTSKLLTDVCVTTFICVIYIIGQLVLKTIERKNEFTRKCCNAILNFIVPYVNAINEIHVSICAISIYT